MKVSRLYEISGDLYAIERLWSRITLFDEMETTTGREMTLNRLRKLQDDIGVVVKELENEIEDEEWLS